MFGTETTGGTASEIAAQGQASPRKGLDPVALEVGECGLFLWTRREQPQFVFHSRAGTETARLWFDGATLDLNRTALGGDVFGQQLTEQDFAMSDGRAVQLRMTPGDQLIGGQRVPEASLTVIDAEGWKTLIPLAGVTACQPER
ncbi:MAG: hypothetical protein CMK09_14690 [Ponticaulis sp.]|nr:hypothetical protein [Ponticaulis sp.]|tara:strand:- start:1763 stop:2194 length:432 start_codon:yes stop_codon:yes gene_type:complete